jgi:hypothetical protein
MRKGRNIKTKNKKYERSNYPDAGKNWPLPKPLPRSGRGFKSSSKKSPSLLGEGDLGGEAEIRQRKINCLIIWGT